MSAKPNYSEIKKLERKVGRTASKMIESSISKQLQTLGLIDTSELKDSIKTKPIMGRVRLFRISTTMARHGFILQQGVNDQRTGHTRELNKTYYSVREHTMILQQKPFITEGIEKSGAFKYLVDEMGKIRMKEVPIIFNGTDIKLK
tara:strand:- start:737 stop:1174 length:438 start_codon:yes stop_codon:yes gene_type:complete